VRGRGKGENKGERGRRLLFVIPLLAVAVVFVLVSVLAAGLLSNGQSGVENLVAEAREESVGEVAIERADTAPDTEAVVERGGEVFIQSPPFALPASLQPKGYEKGNSIETWEAVSDGSCRDVARDLLLRLRTSGMELVEAGYLDLFGEAWGCTLEDNDEASLTIVLIPEAPFKQRSAANLLRMTMIRIALPQQDLLAQGIEKEK
jgi:hypothetical protein